MRLSRVCFQEAVNLWISHCLPAGSESPCVGCWWLDRTLKPLSPEEEGSGCLRDWTIKTLLFHICRCMYKPKESPLWQKLDAWWLLWYVCPVLLFFFFFSFCVSLFDVCFFRPLDVTWLCHIFENSPYTCQCLRGLA